MKKRDRGSFREAAKFARGVAAGLTDMANRVKARAGCDSRESVVWRIKAEALEKFAASLDEQAAGPVVVSPLRGEPGGGERR